MEYSTLEVPVLEVAFILVSFSNFHLSLMVVQREDPFNDHNLEVLVGIDFGEYYYSWIDLFYARFIKGQKGQHF